MYKPDFEQLDRLAEEGFVRRVTSPCGNLFLYNYTDKCTYEKKWNKHTLNARGSVYEVGTGRLVARAFPKFFNFGELPSSKSRNLLKKTKFTVNEKMDGSLGIVYFYKGEWRVNTRGSFTSDQAVKATEMLRSLKGLESLNIYTTYLVEIIYPENRIIVDYGQEEKLTLLAAFKNNIEVDIAVADLFGVFEHCPIYHDFRSIQEVIDEQARLGKLEEGFVVRFEDGERVKFKSAEYLKIARLISDMTPLNFWKAMKDGEVQQEILEEIPEEFREEADRIKFNIEISYAKVMTEIQSDYNYAVKSIGGLVDLQEDRKKLGLFLKENGSELKHAGAIFPMLLNNGVDKYIMKVIRPKGNEIL
jgi:RNA ligase